MIHNRSTGWCKCGSFMVSVVNVSRVSSDVRLALTRGLNLVVGACIDTCRDFSITIHSTAVSRPLLNYYGPLHLSHPSTMLSTSCTAYLDDNNVHTPCLYICHTRRR